LIWTAYQNGINANGTPGSPFGPTQSTIAGYDPTTGALVRTINVSGKIDGLGADWGLKSLLATVNEDANSAFVAVDPESGAVTTFTYSPKPEVSGNGGTDAISVFDNSIFVIHSNPNETTQPTQYKVQIQPSTLIAQLTPVFFDNSRATDALTGARVQLNLTDPDTNFVMPRVSERFGGELGTISQGDGKVIFASHPEGSPKLEVLNVTDNATGNVPPIDSLAVATSNAGTLYVVDAKAGTIQAFDTSGLASGTVFVTEAKDNGNPQLGNLDLDTGVITPFANHFQNPKGLLFVPEHHGGVPDHPDHGHSAVAKFDSGGLAVGLRRQV
jgi:hypothetical protein